MKPTRFASYTLLRHLATGGMGELYLARRDGVAGFSKQVVVKRLRDDLALDEEFVEMFLDEGRLAAMLDHANIVHVYELGEAEGSYFMAMEYVQGTDLSSLLHAVGGPLDLPVALYLMRNICEALAFAHDALGADGAPMHLVHRDVNPQNVLISQAGAVKLTDFGIAKVAQRHRQTQAGILKGKFGYISPEQARGQPIDRRCDIYALGLLLFEMTTGESAVPSGTEAQMLEAAAHGMLRQPQEVIAHYPRPLGDIFRRCTSYRPEDRYANVPDLLDDLLEFQMDARILATPKVLIELVAHHFSGRIEASHPSLTPARNELDALSSSPDSRATGQRGQMMASKQARHTPAPPDLVGGIWGLDGGDEDDDTLVGTARATRTPNLDADLSPPATAEERLKDHPILENAPPFSEGREQPDPALAIRPAATVALAPQKEPEGPLSSQATEALDPQAYPSPPDEQETVRHRLLDTRDVERYPRDADRGQAPPSAPPLEAQATTVAPPPYPHSSDTRATIETPTTPSSDADRNNLMYQQTALYTPEGDDSTPDDAWRDDPYKTGPPPPAASDAFATMALPPRDHVPEDHHHASPAAKPSHEAAGAGHDTKSTSPRWWIFVLASLLILAAAGAAGYYTRLIRGEAPHSPRPHSETTTPTHRASPKAPPLSPKGDTLPTR